MSNVKIEKPLSADSTGKGTLFSGLSGKMPKDTGIFIVMIGIALIFEILGWYMRDQSFLLNPNRLLLIVLQVAIIGIIAVGVTQVIITTGIDLSSGSLIALTAVVAASLAQTSDSISPMYPGLLDLPAAIPIGAGIGVGIVCGFINGFLITRTGIPPFIATLGMMVSARPGAVLHQGQPGQLPVGRLHVDRPGRNAGDHLPGDCGDLPYRTQAHPLRQIHLRHRRQHDLGAGFRHQRQ